MTSLYSVSGASGTAPDLTAPSTPASVSLSPGSTSLGSTLIGSWSAAVTVAAVVQASDGSSVTASVTGSGAGPYSVSIASGLTDGRAYSVRLTGTGTDGQVASVTLLVAVQPLADLTPPSTPAPVSLAAGSTSLGSTAVGSWSRSVTVAATVQASAGSPPTATVSGSGAGPYSVSIASGLADGRTYSVRLRGTGSDGQVADVAVSVAVQTPASVTGSIAWVVAGTYDFRNATTSGPYTSPQTITTGGGLPDITLGQDAAGTYSLTPTNGTGILLSNTGAARPWMAFTPDWAALGIDPLAPEGWVAEIEVASPILGASGFLSYIVGTMQNPNGSGSGMGARLINTAGTRTGIARSVSAGTPELGPTIISQASDYANVSMLGGGFPAEMVGSIQSGTLPATLSGYTLYRDSFTRTNMGTTWGLSPGHVGLLFGGGTLTATLVRARFWRRGVV